MLKLQARAVLGAQAGKDAFHPGWGQTLELPATELLLPRKMPTQGKAEGASQKGRAPRISSDGSEHWQGEGQTPMATSDRRTEDLPT